jgi:hypothetical protein
MINTSASPIDRHRMERIGGDRICDSALTAAFSMGGFTPKRQTPLQLAIRTCFGKTANSS